ncbi:hypothetical protein Taro_018251, partial [Colocasia esculenta]|nr:hypothetical protein [Colocasia esculenta]
RVLNATAVGVAFWLPLLGSTSACAPRVAHREELADVRVGRRRSPRSRSDRDTELRHVPNRCAVFKKVGRTELSQALRDPGGELLQLCWAIWHFGGVLIALSTRGCREEWGKHHAILGLRVLREGGALAPVKLYEHVAHVVGGWITWAPQVPRRARHVSVLGACPVGPYVRDCETERWWHSCICVSVVVPRGGRYLYLLWELVSHSTLSTSLLGGKVEVMR